MSAREKSLRALVEKWLGSNSAARIRVTRFSHSRHKRWRYVCVETDRASGALSIVFFRHDDGCWRVYPPRFERPALGFVTNAALSSAG